MLDAFSLGFGCIVISCIVYLPFSSDLYFCKKKKLRCISQIAGEHSEDLNLFAGDSRYFLNKMLCIVCFYQKKWTVAGSRRKPGNEVMYETATASSLHAYHYLVTWAC